MTNYWTDIWDKIENLYNQGRICSERHLQAEILHCLYSTANFCSKYLLHVEPCIYSDRKELSEIKGLIPDILITQKDKIVAHVELKYVPHGYIPYKKDISSFLKVYEFRGTTFPIYLTVNPKIGEWDYTKKFTISDEIIFIYAIISHKDAEAITKGEEIWTNNQMTDIPRHLFLKGITDGETTPKFYTEDNINGNLKTQEL